MTNSASAALPTLVIVRGPPGTGKSTIARDLVARLGFEHYEADMYHTFRGVFSFQSWRAVDAHHWCQASMQDAIGRGVPAVVGNPLLDYGDVMDYAGMSNDVILVSLDHHYGSTHAPRHVEQRMRMDFVHHDDFEDALPPHVRIMTESELAQWIEAQLAPAESGTAA